MSLWSHFAPIPRKLTCDRYNSGILERLSASFRYREQVVSEETNIHRAAYELNETYLVEKLLDLRYKTENCLQLHIRLIRT